MEINLQREYDLICAFFKTTSEPFDRLDWDGSKLNIVLNESIIEEYSVADLKELISNF